ncbi:MAG: ROK family protein [Bacteroidales bacterium]|nr:ROK family protein [Bacteroidales bacterium]
MKDVKIVGVDIGGTKISGGLVVNSHITQKATTCTGSEGSKEEILSNLFRTIDKVIMPDVDGIGIGVPGIIDITNGVVYDVKNIPTWKELHLKEEVEKKYEVKTYLNNDANCFILGEKIFGKGTPYKNLVGLTLGTGLGTGILIENKIYSGLANGAGEYSMLPYRDANFEMYCSGKFFSHIKKVSGKLTYEAATVGDKNALWLWEEYAMHLSELIKVIIYSIAPEAIILGGSVSKGFEFFIDHLKNKLGRLELQRVSQKLIIERSEVPDVSILGAAALYINNNIIKDQAHHA